MVANLKRLERAAHKLGQIDDADPVDARIAHNIEDELFGGLPVHLLGPLSTRKLATLASRSGVPSLRLGSTLFPILQRNRRFVGGIECTTSFGVVRRCGISLRPIEGSDGSRINRNRPIMGGIIGSILTGVFATQSITGEGGAQGALYGDWHQLWVQIAATVVSIVFSTVMTFLLFKFTDKTVGIRVDRRVEEEGLDIYEHGESAYNR